MKKGPETSLIKSTPFDIDEDLDPKRTDTEDEFQVKHVSTLKIEVSVSKIQADLLDEEIPVYEGLSSQSGFDDQRVPENSFGDLQLNRRSTSQKDDKFALLSVILERSLFKIDLLEKAESKDDSVRVKIGLRINDALLANKLFVVCPNLNLSYFHVSSKIINHPKLFDNSEKKRLKVLQQNREITIDSILQN